MQAWFSQILQGVSKKWTPGLKQEIASVNMDGPQEPYRDIFKTACAIYTSAIQEQQYQSVKKSPIRHSQYCTQLRQAHPFHSKWPDVLKKYHKNRTYICTHRQFKEYLPLSHIELRKVASISQIPVFSLGFSHNIVAKLLWKTAWQQNTLCRQHMACMGP
jgi:hypothetical protein